MCHRDLPTWTVDPDRFKARSESIGASDKARLKTYFSQPLTEDTSNALLLIHDVFGASEFYRRLADRFAANGVACLLLDVFSRHPAIDASDESQVASRRAALDQLQALDDCVVCENWLRAQGAQHVTIIGFCLGGTLSILAPTRTTLDASIIFYGLPRRQRANPKEPISPLDDGVFGKVPVLGFWGDRDDVVGIDNVREYDAVLERVGVPHEFHYLPGLGHAYLTFDESDPAYSASVANFSRACEFLQGVGKGQPFAST